MKMKVKKFSAVLVAFLVAVTSMVLPLSDTFNSVIKTTGSAKAVTKNSAVKMPSDAILFDSSEEKFKEIQSPEKGGFYYYNRSINFYDVNNNTVRKIKDYKDKLLLSIKDYNIDDKLTESLDNIIHFLKGDNK